MRGRTARRTPGIGHGLLQRRQPADQPGPDDALLYRCPIADRTRAQRGQALGLGVDPSFRSPMAIVVIGGLITSTLLTLFVVPAIYRFFEPKSFATKKPEPVGGGVRIDDTHGSRAGGSVPAPHMLDTAPRGSCDVTSRSTEGYQEMPE